MDDKQNVGSGAASFIGSNTNIFHKQMFFGLLSLSFSSLELSNQHQQHWWASFYQSLKYNILFLMIYITLTKKYQPITTMILLFSLAFQLES